LPQLAQQAVDSTAPTRPLRIIYSWSYQDESMRFSGRGSLRVEPPYRGRTDLFGPRGETLVRSVVIGDEMEIPAGLPQGVLPPVSLMWSTIGVLRAPVGAGLELTRQSGDTLVIGYGQDEEHWRYKLVGGRVRHAEWNGPRASRRTVEMRGTADFRLPREVVYRDWAAFRELKLTLEEVHESTPFPPETWDIYR
jgi:hypothetical protein